MAETFRSVTEDNLIEVRREHVNFCIGVAEQCSSLISLFENVITLQSALESFMEYEQVRFPKRVDLTNNIM